MKTFSFLLASVVYRCGVPTKQSDDDVQTKNSPVTDHLTRNTEQDTTKNQGKQKSKTNGVDEPGPSDAPDNNSID